MRNREEQGWARTLMGLSSLQCAFVGRFRHSPFSIDLASSIGAIEFGGPSHFAAGTLEPLGHTRLRDRLLSAMGWQVVSIPFFDWDRLHQPEQMDAYVKHRLLQHPPTVP